MIAGWSRVRVDWLMDEVRESIGPEQLAGREVFHYSIPALAEFGDGVVEDGDSIASAKPLLRGGELLVSKLNPRKAHVLIARARVDPTVCSGEFIVLKPRVCHVRFMFYVFSSEEVRQELDARVQSVTKSHQRVGPDDIAKLWIVVPDLDVQRRIADFLDHETARIDALIQRKREVLRLANLRRSAVLANGVLGRLGTSTPMASTGETALPELPRGWLPVRLRHVAREITVGVVVTPAAFYSDEGLPFIRGYNVRPGVVNDRDLVRIIAEDNALHGKSILRPGDVLVVRTGQAGAAAVVPEWAVGGNCVDVLIVRCGPTLRPKFLELVLNSEHAARQIETMSVGAIQSHFNVSALRDLVLPLPPVNDQDHVIAVVEEEDARMSRLVEAVTGQIQLLKEHRQTLITAAVTGNVDVAGEVA
jgi:type I restriction enzyme S subunit